VALRLTLAAVAVLLVGNAAILGTSLWARHTTVLRPLDLAGIRKGVVVDDHLWRGAAPSTAGYESLAAAGVTMVVDLRSDSERSDASDVLDDLGVELVRIPIRDGQLPTPDDVTRLLAAVGRSRGPVFVHCGAGVGRTGAMVAAYQAVAHASGPGLARRNLAVGPPSLEQIAYAAKGGEQPSSVVVGVSRVLDAPRRIWHDLK
jgi:protein tyrosine phosphatase (PTP) superfamily phosphohydrolase (DUF442 family)